MGQAWTANIHAAAAAAGVLMVIILVWHCRGTNTRGTL